MKGLIFLIFAVSMVLSSARNLSTLANENEVGDRRNELTPCHCKTGNNGTRLLGCIDDEKGELFDASLCLSSTKQTIELDECQDKRICVYRWHNKGQAACGSFCSEDVVPDFVCVKRGSEGVAVADAICQFLPKPEPKPYIVPIGWSQCSRTCGEGVQYKQVECIRKFENGTELQDRSCNIEEVSDLVRPCHNQPCEFVANEYVVASPVYGKRRRARTAGDVNLPAIKAGNGNHWQPKKRQVVEAMIGDRVSAVEGTKIFIKCLFGGKPEPRATWYIGERRIDNQRRLPYSYSYKDYVTTLEIPKMKKYLAGTYACRIENRYGVVKAYSEVRILKAGEATIFSQRKTVEFSPDDKVANITIGTNATVYDNTKVNIFCPVQSYPFRLRVRWRVNGVKSTLGIRRFGYSGTDLQIRRATKFHSGQYICVGETFLGADSESSTLTVIKKVAPKIQRGNRKVYGRSDAFALVNLTIGDSLVAEDGAMIEVMCHATGSPEPKITWLRRGVPIQLPMVNIFSKENGRLLVIRSMREDASDVYSCVASNAAGQAAVDSSINVIPSGAFPPKIEQQSGTVFVTGSNRNQTVQIGQTAEVFEGKPLTFHCPAKGIPKPDISWEFNGKNIKFITGVDVMVDQTGGGLMIVEVNQKIAGKISCIATNVLGSSKGSSEVKILASSQPRIISTGRNVIVGKKSISASVVIGKNLKTSGGRKVKIICAVSGWPIPKVVWHKNGKPVDHPTKKLQIGAARYRGSMLVIESASVTDSGIYTCYAINPAGVAMESSRVKILNQGSPVIISGQSTKKIMKKNDDIEVDIGTNVTTLLGNSLTIKCPFEGDNEADLQWTVDSQPISFNKRVYKVGKNALKINDVTFFDNGIYVCKVWNSKGNDSEASLLRISAPHNSILQASSKISQIQSYIADEDLHVVIGHNITVTSGHNIFITCPVRGVFRPSITWMKNGRKIKNGPRTSVEGEQLLLTDVIKSDSGTYHCFAKAEQGTSNSSTHLTVIVPTTPLIYKSSKDVQGSDVAKTKKIFVGDRLFAVKDLTIEIACPVTAGIPKPAISWYHNSVKIISNGLYSRVKENNDLLIPKLDASLQGVYKCAAENMEGRDEASTTIMIMISIPPSIKKSSRRMTESSFDKPEIPSTSQIAMKIGDTLKTDAGRDIMIDCEANGIPKPRIIWTKDNEDLASSGRVKIFQNGSLLLKSVTEEESGDFTCTVINNRGVDMYTSKIKILGQNTAMVIAEEKTEQFEVAANKTRIRVSVGTNVTTLGGKSLTLLCPSKGEPKPKIRWYKDAIELTPNDEMTIGLKGDLHLEEVKVEDAGRYTCVAENENGKDKMSTVVNVAVLPENLIEIPANYERSDLHPRSVSKLVRMSIGMYGDILTRKKVVIECPTRGSIQPKFTWLLDGRKIQSNGIHKIDGKFLTIKNQEAGDYEVTCRAETFLGTDEMKSSLRFIAPSAPKIRAVKKDKVITDQKVRVDIGGNVKVKFGSQLDIKCPFAGAPIPEIKWFRDDQPLAENDDVIIKGAGSVLRIPFVRMDDNGTYACEASNGVGRKVLEKLALGVFKPERAAIKIEDVAERRAVLPDDFETVHPTIIRDENKTGSIGQNYSILTGTRLVLKCPVAGDPKPDIVWLRNDEVVAKDVDTLILERATADDNGIYVCKAVNVFGAQMVSSRVNVMKQKKPVIQRDPSKGPKTEVLSAISGKGSVEIDIGDDLKTLIGTEIIIRCPAIGIPSPKLSFYKDGKLLTPSDNYSFDYDHGLLTIKKAIAGYEGHYACVAENLAGSSNMTTRVDLIVPVPPQIQEAAAKYVYKYDVIKGKGYIIGSVGHHNISAYPGTELSIDCPVTGFPLPDIIWSKNGKRFNPEYDLVEIMKNGTLVLPHVTVQMQGVYECFAVNVGGGHSKNLTISVIDPVTPIILKSSGFRVMSQTLKTNVTIGEDVEVIFGSEVYINCPFKAEPEGTVMWSGEDSTDLQRRGAVEVNDGKSLLILTATEKSSGVYQCIVSNVFGSDIAKTVLTVGASLKPMITPVKENVTSFMGSREVAVVIGGRLEAPAGTLVSISCPVSGAPRPDIKWFFNSRVIHETKMQSGSEAATYTISKLRLKDTGVYTCYAENVLGSHKASTKIKVGLEPRIQSMTTKDTEISAVLEDTVTIPVGGRAVVKTTSSVILQCFAHGIPMPAVKWYRDGNAVEFNKRYMQYSNGLLEIKSVSSVDEGSFTCTAKNKFGAKKASAHLVVVDAPRIASLRENRTEIKSNSQTIQTTVGGSITVLRGLQLVVSCPAKGIPAPKIYWKRLNAYHNIDPRVGLTIDQSLKINDISPDDAGTYICIAKNKAGIAESRIDIYVAEAPSAKLTSDHRANAPRVDAVNTIVVSNGKSVTIICAVQGSPLPLLKWFKEGQEIRVDGIKYHTEGDELFINSTTAKDAGKYHCVAENMAGRNTATFDLVVGDSPKIIKGSGKVVKHSPTTIKTVVGESIGIRQNSVLMIFCEFKGTPAPVVNWNKNGEEVDPSLLAEGNKILLLKNISYTDAGNYTCMVESDLGADEATSEVFVVDPPKVKGRRPEKIKKADGQIFLSEEKETSINIIKGETIKVICMAKGFPMPKIQWQKNLHDLHQKTDLVSWKETRNVFYRKDKVIGRVYAVLTLKVQEFDSMVGCKVQSSAGRTVAKARITVHEPPRAPYIGVWMITESGKCDGECVKAFIATRSLKAECRTYGGKQLSPSTCNPKIRPSPRKECHTKRCITSLVVGSWGQCSSSCGNDGFRKRSVKCIYKVNSQLTKASHCGHISPRKPRTHEPCNRFKCSSKRCIDTDKNCHMVKSLGYCHSEWSQVNCCFTCKSRAQQ